MNTTHPMPAAAAPARTRRFAALAAFAAPLLLSVACLGAVLAPALASAQQVENDLRMAEASRPFKATAERFIERAVAGDVAATHAMLSRALRDRIGDDAARQALQRQIVPFFASGGARTRGMTVTMTTDAAGQQGYAFYMWWQPAAGAEPRPFSVYTVMEAGQPVVANLVPDRLVPGRHL